MEKSNYTRILMNIIMPLSIHILNNNQLNDFFFKFII